MDEPQKGQDGPGRPSKLTDAFLAAAEAVLADGDDVIICTDEELLTLINENLPDADQITQRTFEAWKALTHSSEELDANFVGFLRLIKRALVREKQSLFKNLRDDDKAWQRWAGSSSANSMNGTSSGRLSRTSA